jgi:hypothetical protein
MVRCQSPAEKWYSRESTSAATPASGHQASATAIRVLPSYRRALNTGAGMCPRWSRVRRSPSGTDRIPSWTSVKAARSADEPTAGPCSSSRISIEIEHRRRWIAWATSARASRAEVMLRAASATARAGITNRISPATHTSAGIRVVRWIRTKPML